MKSVSSLVLVPTPENGLGVTTVIAVKHMRQMRGDAGPVDALLG